MVSLGSSASWEEVVNWVTIPGDHRRLQSSARGWRDVFELIKKVRANIDALTRKAGDGFAGEGAKSLMEHLVNVNKALEQILDQHHKISPALQHCATHLSAATGQIPVPSWVAREVRTKQDEYDRTGQFEPFAPNEFYEKMPWSALFLGRPEASWRSWATEQFWYYYDYYLNTADGARGTLEGQYGTAMGIMPTGTAVAVPQVGGANHASGPGGGGSPRLADTNIPSSPVGSASMPTTGLNNPALNNPALNTAALNPGGLPTTDLSDLGRPGLSDSDLAALGASGGGKLAGGGGFGADGLGSGLGRLGPLVSPDAMTGGQSGAGMAGARLASAAGAGGLGLAGAGAMGVMPGAHGSAGPLDSAGNDRDGKLVEDDKSIFSSRRGDEYLPNDVIG